MNIVVGMADMKTSNAPDVTLITYSLGSCIAVTLYDPVAKVGGLIHFMLPESRIDIQKAQKNPYMFADAGIPLLFKEIYKLGGEKNRLTTNVVGGAQILDDSGYFNIGKRNYTALRKILWMNNVMIHREDVGGCVNRTVSLEVCSGKVKVKTCGNGVKEL
jgi:chemotaxis protein CheD